jgi:bacterioferritin-associated ferredoxin
MYVCICKAVSESCIRKAVAQGACTLGDLSDDLGVGVACGKCVPEVREFLSECLSERAASAKPASSASTLYLARSA